MNVRTLLIMNLGGEVLARLDTGGQGDLFEDPHGGTFTEDEQTQLRHVLQGRTSVVLLGRGTTWETPHHVRLACVVDDDQQGGGA